MSINFRPEDLQNITVVREYLASLVAALIAEGTPVSLEFLVDNFINKDGATTFTGAQSMGGHRLTDVGNPLIGTDAANKEYVDSVIGSGGGGGGSSPGGPTRGKDFVTHQSGDLTIPSGSTPSVISGTTYTLNLDVSGNVSFTVSAVFIGSGTTPSAQFGLRIDGVDYVFAKITEANIGGTFATTDTPLGGVVAVNLTAGSHTIDWIGCSTNGTPKIKASGGVYATMDVDFPLTTGGGGGGGGGTATGILTIVNRPSGSLSSSSGSPVALPTSNFSFTLPLASTVAIDIFLFSEAGFTNFDNSGSFTFALQNTDTLVSTDVWMNTTGVQANGSPSANIQAGFGGIKRSIMTLSAGTYNFQITGRVSGGLSFTVTYPLSIVVTRLG